MGKKSNPKSLREKAKQVAEEIQAKAKEVNDAITEVQEEVTRASDAAKAFISLANASPPGVDWEYSMDHLYQVNQGLGQCQRSASALRDQTEDSEFSYWTTGLVNTTATATAGTIAPSIMQSLPPDHQRAAYEANELLRQIATQPRLKEIVLHNMRRLGFHNTEVGQRALSKFTAACEAYSQSLSDAAGSLLLIREAINRTIDELLNNLTKEQKESPGHKIERIGRYLGESALPQSEFSDMADKWQNQLICQLSRTKEGPILTREQEIAIMNSALTFIQRLLVAIDPNKLKPNR